MVGAVVLALTNPVPQAQYTIVTQSLLTHSVSRMSLLYLFFNLPRPPWESGVASLVSGSLRPQRMFLIPSQIVPSWIVPLQITVGGHLYPLG